MHKYYHWLQRYWTLLFVWLYSFFIVYSTVVPFRFSRNIRLILYNMSQIDWIPFFPHGEFTSRADVVINIVFFIPLGIFLGIHYVLRIYGKFQLSDWMRIILTGAAISTFVEILQLFTYDRQSSTTDIINNAFGTFLGAFLIYAIYLKFHAAIKKILKSVFENKPEFIIGGFFLIFIMLSLLAPFTFRINFINLRKNILEFLSNPFQIPGILSEFSLNFILYGILSYYIGRGILLYLPELKKAAIFLASGSLFIFAFMVEIAQLTVADRRHSFWDPLLGWTGICAGLLLAVYQWKLLQPKISANPHRQARTYSAYADRQFFLIISVVYTVYFIYHLLAPFFLRDFGIEHFRQNLSNFFHPTFWIMEKNRLVILVDLIKFFFLFFPVGFFAAYFFTESPIRNRTLFFSGIILVISWAMVKLFVQYAGIYWSYLIAAGAGLMIGKITMDIYHFIFDGLQNAN